jgi:hypothetical protein
MDKKKNVGVFISEDAIKGLKHEAIEQDISVSRLVDRYGKELLKKYEEAEKCEKQ